uniref:Uncharacterized protein n=1 Tax=Mesocestoides corti TaxID=53468 RepID=A0A5K3FTE2_MESCO
MHEFKSSGVCSSTVRCSAMLHQGCRCHHSRTLHLRDRSRFWCV